MKDLKAMMGKEDEGKAGMQKEAKLSVLKHLRKMASDMMGEDVKGGMMKKVTVAAPDKESLKEGLEKAEEVVGSMPNGEEETEEEYDEMTDWSDDLSKYSPEELQAKIEELKQALAQKQSEA